MEIRKCTVAIRVSFRLELKLKDQDSVVTKFYFRVKYEISHQVHEF